MRDKNEILDDRRIKKVYKNVDNGLVSKLKLEVHSQKASDKCLVSMTCIDGWEHLSVSHKNKIPSWLTMNEMKELFFEDNEECFQFHPKKDNYINNNEYTLHIWRKKDGTMEPPPHILVGFRDNHFEEDMKAAKELHERIGCPLSDEDLRMLSLSATKEGQEQLNKEIKNMSPEQLLRLGAKIGVL